MPKRRRLIDPLTCDDLIARGLASETGCCELCHSPGLTGYAAGATEPGLHAFFVVVDGVDHEAELCCSQATTVNAHEYVGGKTATA
jgi:hypothetical protein